MQVRISLHCEQAQARAEGFFFLQNPMSPPPRPIAQAGQRSKSCPHGSLAPDLLLSQTGEDFLDLAHIGCRTQKMDGLGMLRSSQSALLLSLTTVWWKLLPMFSRSYLVGRT